MSFSALKITNAGITLQLRALAGSSLVFTSLRLGAGDVSAADIPALTALVNEVKSLAINRSARATDRYMVEGTFKNDEISSSFYWKELGIYAADPDYPNDRTHDILYAYQNAYTTAEYISISTGEIIEKVVRVNMFVGQAESVSAVIDSSTVFITQDVFNPVKNGENEITFTEATTRINITSGDTPKTMWGKIKKFFSDLKTVAFSGSYSDLSNKPTSLPADGGNAATVNSHTVKSNVPENAVFTDTTYPEATATAAGIVSTTTQTFAGAKIFNNGIIIPNAIQFCMRDKDGNSRSILNYTADNNIMLGAAGVASSMTIGSSQTTGIAVRGSVSFDKATDYSTMQGRNLASGTDAATTTNTPAGSWRGVHS